MIAEIGVLDQLPLRSGCSLTNAVEETLQLSSWAESSSLDFYWVAEQHDFTQFGCPDTFLMMDRIAKNTNRIEVGSGGTMLRNHNPLFVHENFFQLSELYGTRFALGLGRALAMSEEKAKSCAGFVNQDLDCFELKVLDLKRRLKSDFLDDNLWMLCSSPNSYLNALKYGLNFSWAHFINPELDQEFTGWNKGRNDRKSMITFQVVTSDCVKDLKRLVRNKILHLLRLSDKSGRKSVPQLDESELYEFSEQEIRSSAYRKQSDLILFGLSEDVGKKITHYSKKYSLNRIGLICYGYDGDSRMKSYDLIQSQIRNN